MANPFLALKRIRQIIAANHAEGELPYGVEEIRAAIVGHTNLDYIEFIEFNDPDNPIIGRYEKYTIVKPYTPPTTYVEISYSAEVNFCWQRYTACKEMCHAVLDDDAMCVNDPESAMALVDALLSEKDTRELLSSVEPFKSEKLAEFLALELLCPVEERRQIHDNRAAKRLNVSDMQIAIEYRIPVTYVPVIFGDNYITIVERLLAAASPD